MTSKQNTTFRFQAGEQNYGASGFAQNFYGVQISSGSLTHNGNINISLGGNAKDLNLTHSLYGSMVAENNAAYTNRSTDMRTLYFGAFDENGNAVPFVSSADDPFKASFANFDRIVVREGSTLYLDSSQTEKYFQDDGIGAPDGIDANAQSGDTRYNSGITSYRSGSGENAKSAIVLPEDTTIVLEGNAQLEIDNVKSTGANIALGDNATLEIRNQLTNTTEQTTITSDNVKAGSIQIKNMLNQDDGSLVVKLTNQAADQLKGSNAVEQLQSAAQVVQIEGADKSYQLAVEEGTVTGAMSADVDNNGKIVVDTIQTEENPLMASTAEIGQYNFLAFRGQLNDLNKRMGDLRTMPQASGSWVRFYGGQSKFRSSDYDYRTLQVGADHRIGNFFGGVMGSYTDGDGSVREGSTDNTNYSLGLYGGWFGDAGQFVDVTMKYHHVKTKYNLQNTTRETIGAYSTWGGSLSAEFGWRLHCPSLNFYVEPQVEFTYGRLKSSNHTTSEGVSVHQDSTNSSVGRLGVAFGWVDSDKAGSAFIKASVLRDWQGKSNVNTSKDSVSVTYHEDLGGTWGEFALGGTVRVAKNFYLYGEALCATKASGVKTRWEGNIGARLTF